MPTSIAMVISEFLGKPYDMHLPGEVATTAYEHGWLGGQPGAWTGMNDEGGVALLEHYGIDAHIESGGTLEKLEEYKAEGRDVILSVDSDFIWYGKETDGKVAPDHALVFGGVDETRDPPMVILEDPGNPYGRAEEISAQDFLEAWQAGDNTMIVTDSTPPWETSTGKPPGEEQTPSDSQNGGGSTSGASSVSSTADPLSGPATYLPGESPVQAPVHQPVQEPVQQPVHEPASQDTAPLQPSPEMSAPLPTESPVQAPVQEPVQAPESQDTAPVQPLPGASAPLSSDPPPALTADTAPVTPLTSEAALPAQGSHINEAGVWVGSAAGAVILPVFLAGKKYVGRIRQRA
jgi:hypothetical protein